MTITAKDTARLLGKFDPRRGGHAPGHLREAFGEWADDTSQAVIAVGYDETEVPVSWLFGVLWNCSDIMPADLCGVLDMRLGSTYAMAVRKEKVTAAAWAA